jgi:hypothetical protein
LINNYALPAPTDLLVTARSADAWTPLPEAVSSPGPGRLTVIVAVPFLALSTHHGVALTRQALKLTRENLGLTRRSVEVAERNIEVLDMPFVIAHPNPNQGQSLDATVRGDWMWWSLQEDRYYLQLLLWNMAREPR